MGKRRKIKSSPPKQGSLIRPPDEPKSFDDHPPVFSLQRIESGDYCFSKMSQEDKAFFGEAVFRRKNLSWRDLIKAPRHGLGYEKIAKSSIKGAAIPRNITEEVDDLYAFRFNGKKPMVGYRQKDKFYVIWFDHNLTLYPH